MSLTFTVTQRHLRPENWRPLLDWSRGAAQGPADDGAVLPAPDRDHPGARAVAKSVLFDTDLPNVECTGISPTDRRVAPAGNPRAHSGGKAGFQPRCPARPQG